MNQRTFTSWVKWSRLGLVLVGGLATSAALTTQRAEGDTPAAVARGAAKVYQGIPEDQIEQMTTPDRIKSVALTPGAPSRIWQALEHGEKVDCLDCIPAVESLLYDGHAKNREIAAWWLRRRIFGVFGPGQVYQRAIQTLQSDASADKRARAAEALGEFLDGAGVAPVARALAGDNKDESPVVRSAAARALDRLNTTGAHNELSTAMSDTDESVRLSALTAAMHVHGFTDVASIARLAFDASPLVRRHAASALGAMRAKDAVAALIALTSPEREADATTRAEAVHALGLIGDSSAKSAVFAAKTDPDTFVRDAATFAIGRM
jgi:hypothetical protein